MTNPGFDLHHVLVDRQGEDACTRIEHRREWRSRVEPEPAPGTSLYDTGCLAFVPELRGVVWPHKF